MSEQWKSSKDQTPEETAILYDAVLEVLADANLWGNPQHEGKYAAELVQQLVDSAQGWERAAKMYKRVADSRAEAAEAHAGKLELDRNKARRERDDYRSKFRDLEHELELERGQVVAVTAERDALQARILSLEVDRSKAVKLRDETDSIIWSLKPADVSGAINWGDLGVREVQHVTDDDRQWYRVIIEEADPSNPALHAAVLAGLMALGWTADDIEIETDW